MERYKDKDILTSLYAEHKSAKKVAEILNVNHKTVAVWMKKYQLETVGSQGARKNHLNHNFFEEIDSEEKAYWLGFIMADGCVYRGSDANSLRLQINLKGSDVDHLQKFQHAINSSYKIQEKLVKTAPACILKVNSTKMCQDLIRLNVVPRKSLVAVMPEIPANLEKHYIRGYFDGDGCLDLIRGRLRARISGTKEMLTAIQMILDDIGIFSSLYDPGKNKNISTLEITRIKDGWRFAEWIYEGSNYYLSRKKELFESLGGCPL